MTGASVAVCVVVDDGQSVHEVVAAALAPFDMADDPNGYWDRWRIDGGKRCLPLRAGCEDDPRIVRVSQPPELWEPGRCDGAPRGLLDFTGDREAVRVAAEREWAAWYEIASRYPPGRPLFDFTRRSIEDRVAYPFSAARKDHMDQPVMRGYMARYGVDRDRVIWHESTDPIGKFGYDQAQYVRKRVTRVVPSDELLRLDGVWMEYGNFLDGVWLENGTFLPNTSADSSWDQYYAMADAYLEGLPAEAYIIRVRTHS